MKPMTRREFLASPVRFVRQLLGKPANKYEKVGLAWLESDAEVVNYTTSGVSSETNLRGQFDVSPYDCVYILEPYSQECLLRVYLLDGQRALVTVGWTEGEPWSGEFDEFGVNRGILNHRLRTLVTESEWGYRKPAHLEVPSLVNTEVGVRADDTATQAVARYYTMNDD